MRATDTVGRTRRKSSPRSGTPIHIRVRKRQRDLIDSASAILGKTRSEFMLDTACREAESVILDQRMLQVSGTDYRTFAALLDAPPQLRPGLVKLFEVRGPLEK